MLSVLSKVQLLEYGIPMVSCPIEAQAWLLDLEKNTHIPLFPPSEFWPSSSIWFFPKRRSIMNLKWLNRLHFAANSGQLQGDSYFQTTPHTCA
jgi:hypothetical protein